MDKLIPNSSLTHLLRIGVGTKRGMCYHLMVGALIFFCQLYYTIQEQSSTIRLTEGSHDRVML